MSAKAAVQANLSNLVINFHNTIDVDKRLYIANQYMNLLRLNIKILEDDTSLFVPDYEVWKNVIGWETIYQISNFGRVRSLESFFIKTVHGRTMSVYKPELIRTKRLTPSGYCRTSFWRHGKAYHFTIHRLVAKHFIANPNNYQQVLHIDDNPSNAYFKNLKWGTQSHNILDCSNKDRGFRGSKNGNSKLTENDIPKIRELLKNGKSTCSIAPLFGVSRGPILSIKNNKTWKHVK